MSSIFLCHSSRDKEFARKLADDLRREGIMVWIDEAEIKVGESFIEKIGKGIEEMEYLGVILSPTSIKSNWVRKELNIAMAKEIMDKKIKVLPILYKECKIPSFLQDKKYANFTEDYQQGISELLIRLITDNKEQIKKFEKETIGEPAIKYVDINYPKDIGLQKEYENRGYKLRWFMNNRTHRFLEIEGWEYAYQKLSDGGWAILKVKDRPFDLTLLMKKIRIDIRFHYSITDFLMGSYDFRIRNLENTVVELKEINLEYWHKDYPNEIYPVKIIKKEIIAPSEEKIINFQINYSELEKKYQNKTILKYFLIKPVFIFEINGKDFDIPSNEFSAL